MKIYIHLHGKSFTPGWFDECYGPFQSTKGALQAKALLDRINVNTGRYHDTVKVIRRKNKPKFRTLTWADWIEHCGSISAQEECFNLHHLT
jgi:hypothetical protein